MIIEFLIDALVALVTFVLGLFPAPDPPAWVNNASGYLDTIWAAGAGLGAWVPWTVLGNVAAAVAISIGVGFAIKLIRIVASFLTAGGGAAG